ncbi:unnamed protein product [Leptidea sinapis]|uniref:Uncharacterized protein n=1 Tax=Leptidea sinapis TaxID=189913 RepID=A0A5E4Q2B3_9NEOP|nr:unnamed protein product [Leptidea sinapis]
MHTKPRIRNVHARTKETRQIPQRLVKRKGEDRKQKNIEDIISVLRSTEPDDIPTFVAKDLHKLPPVTFDHIDVTRLLKDIVTLQSQVRALQEKQEEYMTKKDFEISVRDYEKKKIVSEAEAGETEPYVNTKRGGFCLQDSYDSTSGPMGLMTGLSNGTPPNVTMQKRVPAQPSPSYACVAAVPTSKPISVTPVQRVNQVEAHASPPADAMMSCNAMNCEPSGAETQNNNEGEWVRVVRRKSSRFKGTRGTATVDSSTKLKAADLQIPLYIYNVSKENTERDVAEYVYGKTQINIVPEKCSLIREGRSVFGGLVADLPL